MIVLASTSTLITSDGKTVWIYSLKKHMGQRNGKIELVREFSLKENKAERIQIGVSSYLTINSDNQITVFLKNGKRVVGTGNAFFVGVRKASGMLALDLEHNATRWQPTDPTLKDTVRLSAYTISFPNGLPLTICSFSSGAFFREQSGKMFLLKSETNKIEEIEDLNPKALPPDTELTQDMNHRVILQKERNEALIVSESRSKNANQSRTKVSTNLQNLMYLDKEIENKTYFSVMFIPRLSIVFRRSDLTRLAFCQNTDECSIEGINMWKIDWGTWKKGTERFIFRYKPIKLAKVQEIAL